MTGQSDITPAGTQIHRRCVFDLWLNCGHIATVAVDGWYPVWVACCDRLGGTILRGLYLPYDSHVEYVDLLSEEYEHRPPGSPRSPQRPLGRRPRTDDPRAPVYPWDKGTAGRYPARIGVIWNADHSP